MLALICLLGAVVLIGKNWGDSAGTFALAILILLVIVMFCKAWSDDSKAYYHRVQYWRMNGKDRAKARHRWEREAREEEQRERARARERRGATA